MGELQDRLMIVGLFDRFGPVVNLQRADACGVPRAALRRSESRGQVRRVGKAAFALERDYSVADPWERFRLRAMGFGMCAGPTTHLAGWAAAAMHRLPTWGPPPPNPVALRPGDAHTASDVTPYGRVRTGHLPPHHRTIRGGLPTLSLAYTVVDVARHFGPTAGLIVADDVMSRGVHRETMSQLTNEMTRYPGMAVAKWVIENADARCESPLETLGRLAFLTNEREPPKSNVWFVAEGRAFRVDHYLPDHGVVLEADGALKYNNRPDAGEIVTLEKERERLLRGLGLGMIRYNWALATSRPRELVRRSDAEGRRVSGTFRPVPWALDRSIARSRG